MGIRDTHWRLDFPHNGVKRWVDTECFLDDVIAEGELAEALISNGS